jgi:hypothetical protein
MPVEVNDGGKNHMGVIMTIPISNVLAFTLIRVIEAVRHAVAQHAVRHALSAVTRELWASWMDAELFIRAVLAVRPEVTHQRVVQRARVVTMKPLYDDVFTYDSPTSLTYVCVQSRIF